MLEGIGLLDKKSKNNIQWKGGQAPVEGEEEIAALQAEVLQLQVCVGRQKKMGCDGADDERGRTQLLHLGEDCRRFAEAERCCDAVVVG